MKVSCLFLFMLVLACHTSTHKGQSEANAVRDLLIDRVFWKPVIPQEHSDLPINQHKFTITNTSFRQSYRQIQVHFTYYDANYQRIDSAKYIVSRRVEPRSAITIEQVQLGQVNPATSSSTFTVERAETD